MTSIPKHNSFPSLLILFFLIITSCDEQEISRQLDQNQNIIPKTPQAITKIPTIQTPQTPTPKTDVTPSPTPELEGLFIYNQGIRAFRSEEYNDAISAFNMVIKRIPHLALGYKARGGAYYELEKYSRAKEDLQKAIEINPDIGGAYLYLGLISIALGDQDQARIELKKAITLIHPVREKWEYQQAEKVFLNLD